MAWNPGVPTIFNVNRENLLGYSLPPFRAGDQPSTSTITCRYRLRWNRLSLWNDFGDLVSTDARMTQNDLHSTRSI